MRGIEQIPWMYDAMASLWETFGFDRWREWLVGGARGRTLDLGCGTGRNLPLIDANTPTLGVDPSLHVLRAARKRAPKVPLVCASAEALPFKDSTFETVLSGLVFCSVPDPLLGLSEVRRVLKASGRLRMVEHVRSTSESGARWQDFIQPTWTRIAGGCHPNRETEATVEEAGFKIEAAGRKAQRNLRRFSATKG